MLVEIISNIKNHWFHIIICNSTKFFQSNSDISFKIFFYIDYLKYFFFRLNSLFYEILRKLRKNSSSLSEIIRHLLWSNRSKEITSHILTNHKIFEQEKGGVHPSTLPHPTRIDSVKWNIVAICFMNYKWRKNISSINGIFSQEE